MAPTVLCWITQTHPDWMKNTRCVSSPSPVSEITGSEHLVDGPRPDLLGCHSVEEIPEPPSVFVRAIPRKLAEPGPQAKFGLRNGAPAADE